jgi:hypothetical protein
MFCCDGGKFEGVQNKKPGGGLGCGKLFGKGGITFGGGIFTGGNMFGGAC